MNAATLKKYRLEVLELFEKHCIQCRDPQTIDALARLFYSLDN